MKVKTNNFIKKLSNELDNFSSDIIKCKKTFIDEKVTEIHNFIENNYHIRQYNDSKKIVRLDMGWTKIFPIAAYIKLPLFTKHRNFLNHYSPILGYYKNKYTGETFFRLDQGHRIYSVVDSWYLMPLERKKKNYKLHYYYWNKYAFMFKKTLGNNKLKPWDLGLNYDYQILKFNHSKFRKTFKLNLLEEKVIVSDSFGGELDCSAILRNDGKKLVYLSPDVFFDRILVHYRELKKNIYYLTVNNIENHFFNITFCNIYITFDWLINYDIIYSYNQLYNYIYSYIYNYKSVISLIENKIKFNSYYIFNSNLLKTRNIFCFDLLKQKIFNKKLSYFFIKYLKQKNLNNMFLNINFEKTKQKLKKIKLICFYLIKTNKFNFFQFLNKGLKIKNKFYKIYFLFLNLYLLNFNISKINLNNLSFRLRFKLNIICKGLFKIKFKKLNNFNKSNNFNKLYKILYNLLKFKSCDLFYVVNNFIDIGKFKFIMWKFINNVLNKSNKIINNFITFKSLNLIIRPYRFHSFSKHKLLNYVPINSLFKKWKKKKMFFRLNKRFKFKWGYLDESYLFDDCTEKNKQYNKYVKNAGLNINMNFNLFNKYSLNFISKQIIIKTILVLSTIVFFMLRKCCLKLFILFKSNNYINDIYLLFYKFIMLLNNKFICKIKNKKKKFINLSSKYYIRLHSIKKYYLI